METQTRLTHHNKFISAENITTYIYIYRERERQTDRQRQRETERKKKVSERS